MAENPEILVENPEILTENWLKIGLKLAGNSEVLTENLDVLATNPEIFAVNWKIEVFSPFSSTF